MADSKITALAALTAADPINDMFPVVDVSDTSMAASGTTKRISANNILSSSPTASGALTVTGLVTAGSATITGDLTVRTTNLVVTSTGVGMGTATPSASYFLDLTTANDARARLFVADTAFLGSGNLANGFVIRTLSSSTDGIKFTNYAQSTEFMRINSTGNVVLQGGTAGANGVGVTFPATQVASSDANCLDDYEEGTFTPNIGGTATYTQQTGRYTKIGNRVHVTMRLTVLLKGTGSAYEIAGLPFALSASSPGASISIGNFANLATSVIYISGYATGSVVNLTGTTASTASITNAIAVIGNSTDMNISFSYEV